MDLCYVVILLLSAALVVYGFMLLLEKPRASENDVQAIQRQLRGFGFMLLAQVVLVLGSAFCYGMSDSGAVLRRAIGASRL